jgi:AcrR family transcriptional regulator
MNDDFDIVKINLVPYAVEMSKSAKKPYHHGDLREHLITSGEAVLAEMPLQEVSLRAIARRAGVSHAAPKHHFGTLGNLFGEMAARGFERFAAELNDAATSAGQSPDMRLNAMSQAYLEFASKNPAIYGLMFGKRENAVETTPRLAAGMSAAWSLLEDQVEAVVGPERKVDGAVAVWSACHGLAMLRQDRKLPPFIDLAAAIDAVSRIVTAGLKQTKD